jgi:hypothetical protein
MREFGARRLPKRAVTIVLALVVADGAGIYFAHQKLTRPWDAPPSTFAEPQVAEAGTPRVLADNKLPLPAAVLQYDFPAPTAAVATVQYEPLPIAEYKTVEIDLAQYEESRDRVERETVIPKVRIASLRAAGHRPTTFSSAFPSDIARALPSGADASQVELAASEGATGEAAASALIAGQVGSAAVQLPAEAAEAPVLLAAPEPGAALAAEIGTTTSDSAGQESAPQSLPAAPGTNGGSEAELPAL